MQSLRASAVRVALSTVLLVGYGYGEAEDPLVAGFKHVVGHAREGRWSEAERELPELQPSLTEVATVLGVDLAPGLREAVAARSSGALAGQLARLASLAIQVKLESSRREELAQYYAAKYRIEAARGYYQEMLAPGVRSIDRERGTALHAEIEAALDAARGALGRPGFLGRGVVPPDRAAFDRAAERVTAALRNAFPVLSEVTR